MQTKKWRENLGDISIIARRLEDGHVQYGWSGNGGYYKVVGVRLLLWYLEPEDVEYLFGLGQTALIGKRGSEYGGYRWIETHDLTGEPFWLLIMDIFMTWITNGTISFRDRLGLRCL